MIRQRALPISIVALAVIAFLVALAFGVKPGASVAVGQGSAHDKWWVCKYVGTPGVDERLQTGQNPISVNTNAMPISPVGVGSEFADAQGRSLVIAPDTRIGGGQDGEPRPVCPQPPPPTTVHQTTTTIDRCPPEDEPCVPDTQVVTTTTTIPDTTTTSTVPGSTTTTSSTGPPTTPGETTTTVPGQTTTTLPETFSFRGASTICRAEVPTIVIDFALPGFPSLAGMTGILTVTSLADPSVTQSQPLVYQPGGHVEFLYPGTVVNPDGSIADVPGWTLLPNGLWIIDPSDAFLREGILLTYTVNPTAEAIVTYPPESAACANPDNPPPGLPPPFQFPEAR